MRKFKLLRRLILLLIVFSLCFTAYSIYFISPKNYTFHHQSYVNDRIGSELNGFQIAYLSDLNLTDKKSLQRLKDIVEDLNQESFDMVIFGGDLYDQKIFQNEDVSQLLKQIQCSYGKFAVLGDKDKTYALEVQQILNDGGFEVLNNTARTIYYKNTSFLLYAVDQEKDLSSLKKKTPTISLTLTHEPDSFIKNYAHTDLQLSGHSYGGSFYIPYVGALLTSPGAKTYNHGTYHKQKSTLIVSNGLSGPSAFPYKFLAENEVNIITLKTSQQ